MKGIDYGMGDTNINKATGIRYGVIHQHEVLQAWCDYSESDYGPPTCAKCGNEVSDEDEPDQDENGHDFHCKNCEHSFNSQDAYGDEPLGHYLDDGEYKASQSACDTGDIFVLSSPYYTLCSFCSPCAPGAGYFMDFCDDGVKTYCFGHDWFEDGKAPYPVYSVATNEEVLP
jgi:ribosomal protein L37AE/L43A